MIVILALMAKRSDNHGLAVDDLEKRDMAAATERDDQLAKKRAVCSFAAGEGETFQRLQASRDGSQGLLGQFKITTLPGQLALEHEIKQPLEILS